MARSATSASSTSRATRVTATAPGSGWARRLPLDLPLREMLLGIYAIALDMYLSGKDGPRGCFTVMTATSEAVFDPSIRALVMTGLVETDRFFARIFRRAQERGELAASANPQVLALLASGTLHTIAVRARAQVPRAELDAIVNGAVDVMCGPKK